jgi:SAM-dependent methyltransferase
MKTIKQIYFKIFPNLNCELEELIKNCGSILDVGCGNSSPLKDLNFKGYKVGVDNFQESIEKSRKKEIHNKYVKGDIRKLKDFFSKNEFDCVLALDVIEHLSKEEGLNLIKEMEYISKKKVILFTPNGFLPQKMMYENNLQIHKSGWEIKEMRNRGYEVIGIYGHKKLRGELSELKYKPKVIWRIISDITQKFTRENPKKAFALLCMKDKKNKKFL